MDKNQVEKIALDVYQRESQRNQYSVSRVPVHTHNGLDSPKIDFNSGLNNKVLFVTSHVVGTGAATAGNYGHFFHNPLNFDVNNAIVSNGSNSMAIMAVTEVHGRAGNDASAVTLSVAILSSTNASLTGGTAFVAFDLKGTADITTYAAPKLGQAPARIYPGQRLALQTSGTLTNVADVLVTVMLQY